MKRICFVNAQGYSAFKEESVGGTQLQLRNLSSRLADEEDYDVMFVTRTGEGNKEMNGVKLVDGIGDAEGIFSKILSGFKLFRALKRVDADLYFSSNSNMEVGVVGLFCSLLNRRHVTRTVHSMQLSPESVLSQGLKGFVNHLGLRQADLIFVQCNDHREKLEDWFNPRTGILRNSFDFGEGKEAEEEHVLWVGRRVSWKNPDLFLDLAESFESQDFVMISPRTGQNHRFHERIEDRASTIDNLELIERVPREEIQQYFNRAKVFVNTSEAEGFPNTFVESGIGNTPILSYKVDPDRFIQRNDCGFFADGEYSNLQNCLEHLLENQADRRHRGANCRRYVERNHNLEENFGKMLQNLEELLE